MEVILLKKLEFDKITIKTKLYIMLILPISFILLAIIIDTPTNIVNGIFKIIVHPDILITDYIKVGGLGAALINSAILTLVNIYIIWKLKININGPVISAIFIIMGFAFFGKNIFNVWPIYIGGYIYSKYQKTNFKNVILITMFATALSPLVNEFAYGLNLPIPFGILLGISIGILVGFIIPPLSAHMIRVHDGYNLYNIGFAAGFIGTVIMSIMKSYGFIVENKVILSNEYDTLLKAFFTIFFLILIILGFLFNNRSFKGYKRLIGFTGRLITDFTQLTGFGLTLINMGLMGLIGILYVIIAGGIINGPVIGGLLTLAGFSSFGKHPKNSIPILIGVLIGNFLITKEVSTTILVITGLFGTSMAPIAGTYGYFVGILAGFIHLSVVMNVGYLHGGINLYNNGFSSGIVATILVPIIDAFKKED
ncbi:Protein of unknown function [Caloranaerobacter azorensis DSM 13643]|uniref:DUF1576 domain-containing protein n=1 Tax=Caloranaerobacter azorensis DSM 13643 TaxID=1121264 RepID=A0A1M5TDT5_9FIRM|nr:Protein of unknown function [Caloranaerobacter azorensis DSM 13643]